MTLKKSEMQPPKNVHDALRQIDSLLHSIMLTVDEHTEPLAKVPEDLRHVCAAAADARLLAVWVRDQLNAKE